MKIKTIYQFEGSKRMSLDFKDRESAFAFARGVWRLGFKNAKDFAVSPYIQTEEEFIYTAEDEEEDWT